MQRTCSLLVLAFLAFLVWTSSAQRAFAFDRPNVLFLLSDDHRWDALGAAGNSAISTPNLDALAGAGYWFPNATIAVSQCAPARFSLLSGLMPSQNGWYSNEHSRHRKAELLSRLSTPTLPTLLTQAGYTTAFFGKWHLLPSPLKSGFTTAPMWMQKGSSYLDPTDVSRDDELLRIQPKGYTQELIADAVIEFLEAQRTAKEPFFAWVSLTAPHGPFGPTPRETEALYADLSESQLIPKSFPPDAGDAPFWKFWSPFWPVWRRAVTWRRYYAAVTHLDAHVGRIIKALDSSHTLRNTVVIFLGDNGFMMGDKEHSGKVLPYDGSIRVPLIIRVPDTPTSATPLKGAALPHAISSTDISAWISQLSGTTPPSQWPGRDLTPVFRGSDTEALSWLVSEWADEEGDDYGSFAFRAIRTAEYKLILWKDQNPSVELFHLVEDPFERTNLAGIEAHDAALRAMLAPLLKWMEETSDPALTWTSLQSLSR